MPAVYGQAIALRLIHPDAAKDAGATAVGQVNGDGMVYLGSQGAGRPGQAQRLGTLPDNSSCITIMFNSVATDGRPVSTMKCAVAR